MKYIYVLFFLSLFVNTNAQNKLDVFEENDKISSIVITKDMFNLLKKFPDTNSESMEVFNLAKGLQALKVYSTKDVKLSQQMFDVFNSEISDKKLTQLIKIKDEESSLKVYAKLTENKNIVNEVLMFATSKNTPATFTIISLIGTIDVDKLAKIANTFQK